MYFGEFVTLFISYYILYANIILIEYKCYYNIYLRYNITKLDKSRSIVGNTYVAFSPIKLAFQYLCNIVKSSGWLEPLLDRIARNSTTVVCPVIDSIDDNTLHYRFQKDHVISVGGFNWKLVVSNLYYIYIIYT